MITDRPNRWNKNIYDVITLLDIANEYQNRSDTLYDTVIEDEKKWKQEDIELDIKNLEKKMETLKTELINDIKEINEIRKKIINERKNEPKTDTKDTKNNKELKEKIDKKNQTEINIEKIKIEINIMRKNDSEIETIIKELEAKKEKEKIKYDNNEKNDYKNISNELKIRIKQNKNKDDEENQNNYTSVRKNKTNNIIIIDENISNNDIETLDKVSKIDLFDEIRDHYINKDEYSIIINPINININKPNWFKKGIFRISKNKVYVIYANKEDFKLNVFFKSNKDITEFRRQIQNVLPGDNFEHQYQLYKEKKYNEANQMDTEIVVEIIHNIKEYETFIHNRNKFAMFIVKGINNTNLNTTILASNNHKYSKDILERIKKDYGYTDSKPNSLPYTKEKPLSIYYVIVLHNKITKDHRFPTVKTEIANNIGIFAQPYMKGIIIQSVTFEPIPSYEAVEVLKIHNTDKYYVWMKAEPENSDITKKFNGKKIYETHMKSLKNIMNNLYKKRLESKGGTKKKRKMSMNKTRR